MSERHPDIYNEFDLDAARKAGQAYERERIVSLLINVAVDQDALLELNPTKEQAAIIEAVIATTYQLMALIKGEQE